MNFIQEFLVETLAAVGVIALIVLIALIITDPDPTDSELCKYYTVEQSGLQACWAAEVCFLSDEEFSELYVNRKQMIMHCARDITILMLTPPPKVEPEVEVEEPNNDLRAEIDGA